VQIRGERENSGPNWKRKKITRPKTMSVKEDQKKPGNISKIIKTAPEKVLLEKKPGLNQRKVESLKSQLGRDPFGGMILRFKGGYLVLGTHEWDMN